MKLKGYALKLAISIPLIMVFIIYLNIYKNNQESKFNQFIDSYEGKTAIIKYLFYFEGIDRNIIEKYINNKEIPLVNRNLTTEYRIETVLQYALNELNITENEQDSLIQLIETSSEFNISEDYYSVYYKFYSNAENIYGKIAVVRQFIKNETELWK